MKHPYILGYVLICLAWGIACAIKNKQARTGTAFQSFLINLVGCPVTLPVTAFHKMFS